MKEKKMLPDFLVLSIPKSGTTSLHLTLRQHPEICLPLHKETWFFDRNFERGVEWYEEKFWHCHEGVKAGEVTTTLLLDQDFSSKLQQVLPKAKFIVLLRDPIERCISHYFHNVRIGVEDATFEEALKEEKLRVAKQPSMYSAFAYTGIGKNYKGHMQKLFSTFQQDQIMVVLLEEFIQSEESTLRDLFNFIGVSPMQQKLARGNVARMPRSQLLQQTLDLPKHILHGIYEVPLTQKVTPLVLKRGTRIVRSKIAQLLNTISELGQKEFEKPAVSIEITKSLGETFNRELEDLDKLVRKPLSHYWAWFCENQ